MEELILARGALYVMSGIIVFIAFRRFYYSVFDPFALFLLVIPSSIALSAESDIVWFVIWSSVAFWIGMWVSCPVPVRSLIRTDNQSRLYNIKVLRIFTYLFCYISIGASLITFARLGIPLLSDNPSESKVAGFEGLGILRRLQFIGDFAPIGLLILIVIPNNIKRKKDILIFATIILLGILKGSKSSIFNILVMGYFIMKISFVGKNFYERYRKKIKSLFAIGMVFSVGILAFIVSVEAVREGGEFIFSFLYRLMEFGEVMIYYSDSAVRAYCEKAYSWTHFIADELNECLGMLKLAQYHTPIGYNMVSAYWGGKEFDVVTGPNAVFFVKGHIYFGYVGGIVFSFIIGTVFSKLREKILTYKTSDVFKYAIYIFVFFNLTKLLRESGMFFGSLFTFAIFGIPIYIVTSFILYHKNRNVKTCLQ